MTVYLNCETGAGQPAARVGDTASCPKHGTVTIVTGEPTTICGGKPLARVGDKTSCGAVITEGSSSVIFKGQYAAFLGCATSHGGKIISGSPDVFIGTDHGEKLTVEFYDEQFRLVHADTDIPLAHHRYRITTSDGQVWEGISDGDGLTERIHAQAEVELSIDFFDDEQEGADEIV